MPSLKDLRVRINSVKSTQKITSAMKMVAASKLRRAQQQAEAARPYADRMERMMSSLAQSVIGSPTAPKLMVGTGADKVHLLIPVTADRGLAGAFDQHVNGKPVDAGHRRNRRRAPAAFLHEDRPDQIAGGQTGLRDQSARPVIPAIAAQPRGRKGTGSDVAGRRHDGDSTDWTGGICTKHRLDPSGLQLHEDRGREDPATKDRRR